MLGLPPLSGNRRYLLTLAVDSLGSGLFFPVSLLFFVRTSPLGVAAVGSGLALATAFSLPTGLAFGSAVDRWGARNMLALSNGIRAVAFGAYPLVGSWWALVAVVFIAQCGDRAFYAAYAPLTTQISTPETRRQWFGLLSAARNAGFALGGVVSGVVVSQNGRFGLSALVLANAATFAAAGLLLLGIRPPPLAPPTEDTSTEETWQVVARDRRFLALCALNVLYALPSNALTLVLPLYLVASVGLPGWSIGLGFGLNCVLAVVLQNPVVRWVRSSRPHGV